MASLLFTWACVRCGKMHYNDTHFRTHCRDEDACNARVRINFLNSRTRLLFSRRIH